MTTITLNVCRLCRQSNMKMTNSIDDDIVLKLLESVPKIVNKYFVFIFCLFCFDVCWISGHGLDIIRLLLKLLFDY